MDLQCPLPLRDHTHLLLAHGGGGRLTRALIDHLFAPAFDNPALAPLHDGALLDAGGSRFAFTTDSFVVKPLFFPGGDIGSLAVHGTVNDLAMCGARPLALSAGLILEEGLPMDDLRRVVASMAAAAREAGVPIVTGDTKVVDRGKGDGVFINTSGLGLVAASVDIDARRVRPGDRVLLSGPIAEHGVAILSVREGLKFGTPLRSDSAALHGLVAAALAAGGAGVRVLRDPTRGGVATALNEIAAQARVGIRVEEPCVPVGDDVRGACELLGLDPLYVANEGKCLVLASPEAAGGVLEALRSHHLGTGAVDIGEAVDDHHGRVTVRSSVGGIRLLDLLSGEQLPRIC